MLTFLLDTPNYSIICPLLCLIGMLCYPLHTHFLSIFLLTGWLMEEMKKERWAIKSGMHWLIRIITEIW